MNDKMKDLRKYLEGVRGYIFDYGGTIDTGGEHWSHVIRRGWEAAGIAADEVRFREAYVYAERELARTLHILPHHNFGDLLLIKADIELQWMARQDLRPPEDVAPKAKIIADYCYDVARAHAREALPVLEKMAAQCPMVLVSNFYGNIETVLKDFGLDHCFRKIIESAVVGVRKPDPEIFRMGVRALELPAEQCLVVGDSFRKDIEPALKAGCRAVWIKGAGWTPEEDAQTYPYTIVSLKELTA